ncbi:DUF779 domain-containing protein [Undibacterium sp. SXout7W]|uniref:DUF779 domain-containing protein n=1 Tax=Undibacterium sp. SXout7W TaxID=3413049 RepID=UPI003BF405B5
MNTINNIVATEDAISLLMSLKNQYGPLILLMSGTVEEGSLPMCYQQHELHLGPDSIYVGEIGDTPFFMTSEQLSYWKDTNLKIDIAHIEMNVDTDVNVDEEISSFDDAIKRRFLTCSDMCDEEENLLLEKFFLPGRR